MTLSSQFMSENMAMVGDFEVFECIAGLQIRGFWWEETREQPRNVGDSYSTIYLRALYCTT
jgi:hypothetical protein